MSNSRALDLQPRNLERVKRVAKRFPHSIQHCNIESLLAHGARRRTALNYSMTLNVEHGLYRNACYMSPLFSS